MLRCSVVANSKFVITIRSQKIKMDFVRARTEEQETSRQEEIINACDVLFGKYGYEGVHFKAISEYTSFKRPTIYLYIKDKR